MVLLGADGVGVRESSRHLGVEPNPVRAWRNRWREAPAQETTRARLCDRPRSGAPAKYTPEQICEIVDIACERPEDSGRPTTHWTSGRSPRREFEYIRHGTQALIGGLNVASGQVLADIGPTRGEADFARFLARVLATSTRYPMAPRYG